MKYMVAQQEGEVYTLPGKYPVWRIPAKGEKGLAERVGEITSNQTR
jgi:hypothetical protein